MKLMHVYSIYDAGADVYLQPFFQPADAAAIRIFSKMCTDENSSLSIKPDDFTLYNIGVFDDETGSLEPREPTSLGNGRPLSVKYKEAQNGA